MTGALLWHSTPPYPWGWEQAECWYDTMTVSFVMLCIAFPIPIRRQFAWFRLACSCWESVGAGQPGEWVQVILSKMEERLCQGFGCDCRVTCQGTCVGACWWSVYRCVNCKLARAETVLLLSHLATLLVWVTHRWCGGHGVDEHAIKFGPELSTDPSIVPYWTAGKLIYIF